MSLRIPTPEDVRLPQDTRFKVGDTVYMNKKALEQQGMPTELLPENTTLTVTRIRTSAYADTPEYICDNNEGTYTLHETDLLPERMPEENTTTAAADAPLSGAWNTERRSGITVRRTESHCAPPRRYSQKKEEGGCMVFMLCTTFL